MRLTCVEIGFGSPLAAPRASTELSSPLPPRLGGATRPSSSRSTESTDPAKSESGEEVGVGGKTRTEIWICEVELARVAEKRSFN